MTENYRSETILPALRCIMGSWIYYVSRLPFSIIDRLFDDVAPSHKTNPVSFLTSQPNLFFYPLVVSISDATPSWRPLRINDDSIPNDIQFSIGLLILHGQEKLSPIRSQHLIEVVRQTLAVKPELALDELPVIFISPLPHSESDSSSIR